MRLRPSPPASFVPPLLGLLALLDLRVDLQLLADHFTVSALGFAVAAHPLSVAVLALLPYLWRRC